MGSYSVNRTLSMKKGMIRMTLTALATRVVRGSRLEGLPVAIIGAGPIGLAAAAHLLEREIDFIIFEAGPTAAASIATWGHTRLFSPWSLLIDPAAERLLQSNREWVAPDRETLPTGADLIRDYLKPLSKLPQLQNRIQYEPSVI